MIRHNSIASKMFSVENLKRLATAHLPDLTRQANTIPDTSQEAEASRAIAKSSPGIDHIAEQLSGVAIESHESQSNLTPTRQPVAGTNVVTSATNGYIDNDTFVIPIKVSAADLGLSSDLSARLSIRINVDLGKLINALEIPDERQRLEKMRQIIQTSEPQCELSFDP